MKNLALNLIFIVMIVCGSLILLVPETCLCGPQKSFDVDFDNVELKEVVFMVSELTGSAFLFQDDINIPINWIQKNVTSTDIIPVFTTVISSLGLSCQKVKNQKNIYVIKKDFQLLNNSNNLVAVHNFINVSPETIDEAATKIYGDRLSVSFQKESKTVIYSGSAEIVQEFAILLYKIDKPVEDILSVRLRHISVKSGLKAIKDLGVFDDTGYFPDYWNRSIVLKGSDSQLILGKTALYAIDKPQKGWIDQVEFVHTIDVKQATVVLSGLFENLEIREVSENKILISGASKEVEKASVMLGKIDGSNQQVRVETVIAYLTDREFYELGLKLSHSTDDRLEKSDGYVSYLVSKTGILLDYFNELLGISLVASDGNAQGEIITSPVITVLNGQTGRIHVGQNVPFISKKNEDKNSGKDTETSIERKDVGITFSILPSISVDGDFIHLKVNQEVSNVTVDSELSESVADIILDKKEISTTVMVADGETIFLGGIRSEESGKSKEMIPLLGEIPIIGPFLFTYSADKKETRHLIVSLRVKVLGKG